MPEIKSPFEFEPDANARQYWLGTRKRPFTGGNMSLEGFYQTKDYDKDTRWVMIALFVEVIAVILTVYGGAHKGGLYLGGSIIAVVLFVFFDYIGSELFHSQKASKTLLRNKILVEQDAASKAALTNTLKKLDYSSKTIIGVVLIVLSALLKVAAMLLLVNFKIIFYVIILLFYLIVIYIHLTHTGYFLAEWNTEREFKKQHSNWASDVYQSIQGMITQQEIRFQARKLISRIETELKLNIPEEGITVGAHSLKFIELITGKGNAQLYTYDLETVGVLKDDDIIFFIGRQNPEQSAIIARNILKHQIEIIH